MAFLKQPQKKQLKKLYPTQVSIPSEKQLNLVISLSTKRHKIVSGRLFPVFPISVLLETEASKPYFTVKKLVSLLLL